MFLIVIWSWFNIIKIDIHIKIKSYRTDSLALRQGCCPWPELQIISHRQKNPAL